MVVDRPKIRLLAKESMLLAVSGNAGLALGDGAGDAEVWNTILVTGRSA